MKIYQTMRAGLVIVFLLSTSLFSAAAAAAASTGRTLREFMASSDFKRDEVVSWDFCEIDLRNKNLTDLEGIEELFGSWDELNPPDPSEEYDEWVPVGRPKHENQISINASGNKISSLSCGLLDERVERFELKGNPLTEESLASFPFLLSASMNMIFLHRNFSEIMSKLRTKFIQYRMYSGKFSRDELASLLAAGQLSREAHDAVVAITTKPESDLSLEERNLLREFYTLGAAKKPARLRFNRNMKLIFRLETLKRLDGRLPLEALVSISAFAGGVIKSTSVATAAVGASSVAGHKRPRGT